MSKSLRWSEKWFRRGLWLVALVFAAFLIGLGGQLVGDLPKVEEDFSRADVFLDQSQALPLQQAIRKEIEALQQAQEVKDQAQLRLTATQSKLETARHSFHEWVATRQATALPNQDAALIKRTQALEALGVEERKAKLAVLEQDRILLEIQQRHDRVQDQLNVLHNEAAQSLIRAQRKSELRVFLYRLALTLPLLAIAGWLFVRQRKSSYWPFVWGFIFFAGFTFFYELVPYLPSYGGYVRYIVGIVVTILIGRYAIQALNRYLQKQKQAEQMPALQRHRTLDYDQAQVRLEKNVCPGCERKIDLKAPGNDYCPHCGIGLFVHCPPCGYRHSAFAHYCPSCGERNNASDEPLAQPAT